MESDEREQLTIAEESESKDLSTQTLSAHVQLQAPAASKRRRLLVKIFLVLGNLIANVGLYITTPIYTTIMTKVSDIYNLLIVTGFFFPVLLALVWIGQQCLVLREPLYFVCATPWKTLVLCGFLSTVQNIVVNLATLPTRTPSYLCPLLSPAIIPITAFVRYCILKKTLTVRQIICCGVVVLGVFVSATPTIFSLNQRDDNNNNHTNNNNNITDEIKNVGEGDDSINQTLNRTLTDASTNPPSPLWPMLMILAQIPVAVNYVIYETSAQRRTKELILFYFWTQLFGFLWVLVLFWCDVIPGFGQATSFEDFFVKLNGSLACHFGLGGDESVRGCDKVPTIFVLNTFSYVGADVFLIALMAVTDGAVFSTLVSCLSLPLSAFFWMLFKYEEILALIWDPILNFTALFPLAGLWLLVPSIAYYELSTPSAE